MMRIVFLGTAAAIPTTSRGLPCVCIDTDAGLLVFDVGEGSQAAFARAGLGWNKKMSIFVTHLHGDHCLGLLGMIQTMSMRDRRRPLYVYGPEGTAEFVKSNMRMLRFSPSFEMAVCDTQEGVVYRDRNYTVSSCRAEHTIPALSYLFSEDERPGRFHPERAASLGVREGPLWKELQMGRSVMVGNHTILPQDVLGESRPGRRIGYSGDTRPTSRLEEFFVGCDYLIFDSTFTQEHADRAVSTGHSTASGAAALARNAKVKNLILTHFSSRYVDDVVALAEARRIHPCVMAAADQTSIQVV